MVLERPCGVCGKTLSYKRRESFNKANKNNTMCPSCRTSHNNKSDKRNTKKDKNPTWKGYKEIPGKVFSKLKRDAKIRNIVVNITIEDISEQYEKQNKCCAFTGTPLIFGENASVDRINSEEGYEKSNIQIVHKHLNIMKKDMPNELFLLWCQKVARWKFA